MGRARRTNPPATKEPWSDFLNPLLMEWAINIGTKTTISITYSAIKSGLIHSLHWLKNDIIDEEHIFSQ